MIPGMGGIAKDAQEAVDRGELRRTEAIIRSMTRHERRDPGILTGARRRRIAAGSGTSLTDVNRLVKQFSEIQRVMKQMAGGRGRGMLGGMPMGRRWGDMTDDQTRSYRTPTPAEPSASPPADATPRRGRHR